MAPQGVFAPLSREGAIVLNNLLLCSITAVVFVGTLYPLFLDLLTGQMISVGPPFYNLASAPLALPLVMAMAMGPLMAWKRAALWPVLQRLWWAACVAMLAFIATLTFAGWHVLPALGFACAAWLIAGAATDIADRVGVGRTKLANAWNRAKNLPRAAWGAAIAHAGMGVTILGVSGMGLATQTLVALPPGGSTQFAGYEWRLEGVRDFVGPNFTARKATITVLRDGEVVHVMEPSRRFFAIGSMTTTEAAIRTNLARDLYAVLGEERNNADGVSEGVIRLHNNPLAPWIWIGAGIMALGAGLSLSDRRVRIAAPNRRRREAEEAARAAGEAGAAA
jgi:cytochrome c-type biogenesis protein CcmF